MAITHPNSVFRWEDAASLEHACWACPTKANSPRALQTCYGTHSMPCLSYHPTMHALGAAHRCSGCVMAREMHEGRHREIAELLVEYRAAEVDGEGETRSGSTDKKGDKERNVLGEIDGNRRGSGGGLRARTRNRGREEREEFRIHEDHDGENDENEDDPPDEDDQNPNENDDDSTSLSSYAPSSTDHSSSHTPCTPKPTKAQIRNAKRAKKSAKATSKALKNQTRHLATVTSTDIDRVARILHGDTNKYAEDGSAHPLATDKTVEDVIARNLGFVKSIQAHKAYLFASVAKGRREIKEKERKRGKLESAIEMEGVVGAIMAELGVKEIDVLASTSAATSTGSFGTPTRSAGHTFGPGRKRASSGLPTLSTPGSAGRGHGYGSAAGASGASRAALAIAVKLRNAIRIDLEKHENEVHARYIRAGGFWRYVGKSMFERMTEFAREMDVATGESWEKKWAREGRNGGEGHEEEDDRSAEE